MPNQNLLLLLGGVALAAGLGAVLLANREENPPETSEIGRARNRVRSHLRVAEDCSLIELLPGHQEAYEDDLGELFELARETAAAQGITGADELAEFLLIQILPECVIPPPNGFAERPDLALLFTNMRGRIKALLGEDLPDVTDQGFDKGGVIPAKKKAKFHGQ